MAKADGVVGSVHRSVHNYRVGTICSYGETQIYTRKCAMNAISTHKGLSWIKSSAGVTRLEGSAKPFFGNEDSCLTSTASEP